MISAKSFTQEIITGSVTPTGRKTTENRLIHNCECCGSPVRIYSSGEGTNSYEPVSDASLLAINAATANQNLELLAEVEKLNKEKAELESVVRRFRNWVRERETLTATESIHMLVNVDADAAELIDAEAASVGAKGEKC